MATAAELIGCLAMSSGYLVCFCSNVLATLGSACAQLLQEAVPTFQLNLSRYVFQVILCGSLVFFHRETARVDSTLVPPLLLAGLFSNLFNISYYTASALLPLGTLLVLTNVTQIVNSCVINRCVFGKSVVPLKYLFMVLMIVGLVFILQPGFIFHDADIWRFSPVGNALESAHNNVVRTLNESVRFRNNITVTLHNTPRPATIDRSAPTKASTSNIPKFLLGVALAIGAGVSSTSRGAVYKAKLQSLSTSTLGLWIGLLGAIPSMVLMLLVDRINTDLTGRQVGFLLGHGIGAASYSTLNIYAQQKLSPVTWAMLDNTKLVFNFLLQYTLLSDIHPGHMNALEVLGAIIANIAIIGSVLIDIKGDKAKQSKVDDNVKYTSLPEEDPNLDPMQ